MLILSPNSRKCLTPKTAPRGTARFAPVGFALLILAALASSSASASIPSRASLQKDLASRNSSSFEKVIQSWQHKYSSEAFEPLLQLAQDRKLEDMDRYIALMGAAKLGGKAGAPRLVALLKDRSWMLRCGALRVISALGDEKSGSAVLPLLEDPALVVRSEAVQALARLRLPGASRALVKALKNIDNYHGGKAEIVPQQALRAIADLHATDVLRDLEPLLHHTQDPALQRATIRTLESLTGKRLAVGSTLGAQSLAWRNYLARK